MIENHYIVIDEKLSKKIKEISLVLSIFVVMLHTYNIDIYNINEMDSVFNYLIWFLQNFISNIGSIAVPMFFCISGFLFFYGLNGKVPTYQWYRSKYKKRIYTLVIPYLLWNTIMYVVFTVPNYVPQLQNLMSGYNSTPSIIHFLTAIYNSQYTAFWFILDLIILVIITPLIYKIVSGKNRVFVIIILFGVWLFFGNLNILDIQLVGLVMFSFGSFLAINTKDSFIHKYLTTDKTKVNNIAIWMLIIIINIITYKRYIIINQASILVGMYVFWKKFNIFKGNITFNSKFLTLSFAIYAMHGFILESIEKIILKLGGTNSIMAMIDYIVAPIATIVVIYFLVMLMKKYMSRPYEYLMGKRV